MAIPMPVVNENFDEDVYSELGDLRSELAKKDAEIQYLRHIVQDRETRHVSKQSIKQVDLSMREEKVTVDNLTNDDIARYSRQLVLPEIGVPGQLILKRTSVLIVGAGGLGCPAAIYLAAAGIGKIGIVDNDEVEVSNLHRQILHKEKTIGIPKAESVADSISELNSSVIAIPHYLQLNSANALAIVKQYDIIVDATDNVATRYLLSDACVLAGRPLVSGSALRFEGQLTVYNHKGGPCYRCLFPTPPTPEAVTNCSDGGVLGAVPGVIGCLQSLEVIKIATGLEASYSQKMLVFDGLTGITRTVKLRPRQPNCAVCGTNPSIRKLIDYEQFCGQSANDKCQKLNLLKQEDRISCAEYKSIVEQQRRHILIDVRPEVEIGICRLPDSINIPLTQLEKETDLSELKLLIKKTITSSQSNMLPVFVVCRQGNDSQLAVETLRLKLENMPVTIKDIKGGLHAWAKDVDPAFPVY